MWPYWLMFLLPALASLSCSSKARLPTRRFSMLWLWVALIFTLLIGWRHQVGGDWLDYEYHFATAVSLPWDALLAQGDFGYWLLLGLVAKEGFSYHTANLAFGLIFTSGFVAFCRQQPRPWLAITVAVPYLVIVLGMGYTRQGVALGLAMLGLVALGRGSTWRFVLWVALGATFHKSAVVLVPLAILAAPSGRILTMIWVGVAAAALYWSLLAESTDRLIGAYVDSGMESQGAAVRVAMNVVPALLLLVYRRRFSWVSESERNLWTMLAWISVGTSFVLALTAASTAVDRLALYLIPVQIFVFTRLPDALTHIQSRSSSIRAIVFYYLIVQFVWLVFATHSHSWLPYQFYPWMLVFG